MTDVAVVNAFVLYNHLTMLLGCHTISENDFRDELVLQIIEHYCDLRGRIKGTPRTLCRVYVERAQYGQY